MDIKNFINLKDHPYFFENDSEDFKSVVKRLNKEFVARGVLVITDLFKEEVIDSMVADTDKIASQSFRQEVVGNAYLSEEDESLPLNHPMRMMDRTSVGVLAYDQIPQNHKLSIIYHNQYFRDFLSLIVGRGSLYQYGCPLGALNISVMIDGDYLRWHFDQSDFVVSIALQNAEIGGAFEYVDKIRSASNPNFDQVKSVLLGDRTKVETLSTPPGGVVLFEGKYTIHRVSEIKGLIPRYMALLGYVSEQGTTSSEYLRKIRYGRTK